MLTASSAPISLSVSRAVSAPAPGTASVSPAANTTSEPAFTVEEMSPTNTASHLGGMSDIFAAASPLASSFLYSRAVYCAPRPSSAVSSSTEITPS